jgi:tetratricopeptide (TPR) repeat protein
MLTRAQELDPLAHRVDVATALLRAGRYEEALREAGPVIELDPTYARGHATLGWAYLKKGLCDEGLVELKRSVTLSPGNTNWLAQLGQAYGLVGKVGEAREVLQQLQELSRQRYVSPYHMAYVYTGLGEQDAAIDWLERACVERAGAVYGIKGSFLFTTLRSHPRFTALLKKLNLA